MNDQATTSSWTADDLRRFIRPNFFVFTALITLLGVAAGTAEPDMRTLLYAVVVAVSFHTFAYVQNDVLDLPVDRTQPRRAKDPLVTGLISPRAALALAMIQVPVALMVTYLANGPVEAYAALAVGFTFMTIYNKFGKTCSIPMLTDAVQGIAWGSLAIYGSAIASGSINWLSFVAASFGFGFIFLINGVHGGLRDLINDNAVGCSTTAIFFGAHDVDGQVISTTSLRIFAFVALATHIGPATVALAAGEFGYEAPVLWYVWGAWILVNTVSVIVLLRVTAPVTENRVAIISYHGTPLLLAPFIIFLPRMSLTLCVVFLLCYYVPILLLDRPALNAFRWYLGRQ